MHQATWRPMLVTAVLAVLAASPAALAQAAAGSGPAVAEAGAPTQVAITIRIIAASPTKGEVDKRLVKLQKRLSDFAFASYRLLSEQQVVLGLDSKETLTLPGNRVLEIRPLKFEKSGKLRIGILLYGKSEAKLMDADYSIEPGGDILIGGPKWEDGALLVFIHHDSAKQAP